ncbi:restriction endonuclease subunit S [Micromonospora sp. NPDC049645]|uniref:restriction endonuclease subunit S n=1 Tax=Micromonospora sp. NPDC049645 TaxID=3155508 RepID=UPI003433CD72
MTLNLTVDEIIKKAELGRSAGLIARHESWSRVRLAEIARVENGAAFSSAHFNKVGDGLPLIRIRDVGGDTPTTYYSGDFEPDSIVHPGDLLIGMDGDFRAARWRNGIGLLNQRVCRVVVTNEGSYDPNFLAFVLQGYLDSIWLETSSVTVKHLSSRTVEDIPLPLPPRAEQRRIVAALEDHLSRLGVATQELVSGKARIVKLRRALEEKAIAGALLPKAASSGTTKVDLAEILDRRADLVGKQRRRPIEPAWQLSNLPNHWALASVDQITWNIEYGTSAKAGPKVDDSDVAVLRMGNIQGGEISTRSLKYLPASHPDIESLLLDEMDVLFNRTNSAELVGKSAAFRGELKAATFASYLIRCRLLDGVEPNWVALVINSSVGRLYVRSVMSQQVGQANVNGTKLAAMPIPLPPLDEQRQILALLAECLAMLKKMSDAAGIAERKAARLKESLLAEAFAGRLVPQDPHDEPASELLARIRAERAAAPPKQTTRSRRTKKKLAAPPTRVTGDDYQQEALPL